MVGQTTNISICLDSELKAQVETALNTPNKKTIAAMLEAKRIAKEPSVKGYGNMDDLVSDLKV